MRGVDARLLFADLLALFSTGVLTRAGVVVSFFVLLGVLDAATGSALGVALVGLVSVLGLFAGGD